jgi:hypothetical protein
MPYKNPKSSKAIASNLKKDRKYKKLHREEINSKSRERTKNDPEYRKRMIEKTEKYIAKNRKKVLLAKKKHHLKQLYGLSWETYKILVKKQRGVCAICHEKNVSNRKLAVDHDHETKEIRALLCDKCNRGLGFFDDSIEKLQKAIKYLKKYAISIKTISK